MDDLWWRVGSVGDPARHDRSEMLGPIGRDQT
jgi:hypothetical protein